MTPVLRFLFVLLFTCLVLPVAAEDDYKPDDMVAFDLVAEDWVSTTTARVTVNVDAAVAGNAAGTMRTAMQKAVNALAEADWRLTNFSRGQDQTGLERWGAVFEARVVESQLGGIHDTAKKLSKAGMQVTIAEIAFDPTLAETEAVKVKLRNALYKQVADQLASLNAAIPGRQYRVNAIDFGGMGGIPRPMMQPMQMMQTKMAMASASGEAMMDSSEQPMQRAQKIMQQARVVFAALPPVAAPATK